MNDNDISVIRKWYKNVNSMLISRMFNVKGKLSETEEFHKAKIIPKTIRIEIGLPQFQWL